MPVQRIITFMKTTILVALLGAIVLSAIKESPRGPDLIVLNRNFVVVQAVTFGVLLASLVLMFTVWGVRIARSFHSRMAWSTRRLRAVQVWSLRVFVSSGPI